MHPTKFLKAIYAGVSTAIGTTSAAYVSGGNHVGLVAGLTILGASLAAFWAVWGVPNAS